MRAKLTLMPFLLSALMVWVARRETARGYVVDQALTQRTDGCSGYWGLLSRGFRAGAPSFSRQEVPRSYGLLSGRTILVVLTICIWGLGRATAFAGTLEEDPRTHQTNPSADTQVLRDIIRKTPWAFATSVGDLEARAELCLAPPISYESVVRDARALLPDEYRQAGRDPSDIEQDIVRGKNSTLAMHQANPRWPPDVPSCPGFMSMVVDLRCWVLVAQGKTKKDCPPLPPPEQPGWQGRLRSSAQPR